MEQLEADCCVIGAGYSGLVAARTLSKAGRSVVVLEARDRVGGRVWTQHFADGTPADFGGTWLGHGHDHLRALAREFGIAVYPTHTQGSNVLVDKKGVHRYDGLIPPINPIDMASFYIAAKRLDAMGRTLPINAPWSAKNARAWDRQSAGDWLSSWSSLLTPKARQILATSITEAFTSDPAEVSLMDVLFQIRSSTSLEYVSKAVGGAQESLIASGMGSIAERIVAELGDVVRLQSPVREIAQDASGVTVSGDGSNVRAKRAIVTAPPPLQSRLTFDPPLPQERAQLLQRWPTGIVVRAVIEWPEPFWRSDGLSGMAIDFDSPIKACIDASPQNGQRGVLSCYAFGPNGREMAGLEADRRKEVFLRELSKRLGPKAASPLEYKEYNWTGDAWAGGAMMSHFPPGVMTNFGHVLRLPAGRLHWAGTETATNWRGMIEGAVRSGERAAAEVLAAD